ncbi:MAG: PaaI family thioesterase [Candidatus Acidiferrales bacterium]
MAKRTRRYAEIRSRFARVGPVRMLGMKLGALRRGRAELTLDPGARHAHPYGVHGGVLAALADTAMAMAVFTLVPTSTRIATVEMKINYLAPHQRGRLRAEAKVLRLGKRLAVGEAEIRDRRRQLIAKSLMTYSLRHA